MINFNKLTVSLAFLSIILSYAGNTKAQEKSFSVFSTYQDEDKVWMRYTDNSNALYHHVASLAMKCLDEHDKKIASFVTAEAWNLYLKKIREESFSSLRHYFKTPLHAKTTGILERNNFKAEKIVFESLPGFHVTGCLFIPKTGNKPFPTVLVAIGHSQTAFRRDLYQHDILNLVSKGFVVFTYDPLSQGERIQYFEKEKNKSLIGVGVPEHSFAGAQSLLLGHSISDNFLWDGVRALDFLCSRPEVDTTRIGMTGISGGGTQTAFLSAYDKRIKAAAPECFVTSFQRIFESIGPQDAEQNMYHGLKKGVDHIDLLSMRAPKPTLVITTTEDFFSIQGARETVAKTKKVYSSFGKPGNITMVESTGSHGSEKDNRESMYSFFRQYLNNPGSIQDEEIKLFTDEELKVTSTGQVSTAFPDSKTIFDLNCEEATQILKKRNTKSATDLQRNRTSILKNIKKISGFDSTRSISSVVFTGKIIQPSYKIEKYFIQGKDFEYPIPFVLIKPLTNEKRKALLYLSAKGKDELLNNSQEIEKYISQGYSIIAPDMIGTGELKNTSFTGDSNLGLSYNILFSANLAGKSLAGIQASDLNVLFKALENRKDIDLYNFTAIVKEEACSSYLHFAVFKKNINKTILMNPLISYEDLIFTRRYDQRQMWTAVPGALPYYDLPFLESLLAPKELIIIDPVNAKSETASEDMVNKQTRLLLDSYDLLKASNQIKIITKPSSGISEYLK